MDRIDRPALARRGLPAGRAGLGRPQAVLAARLGALDHPLRLRALRSHHRNAPACRGPELRTPQSNHSRRAVHNRPHTLRHQARTDDAFLLAVRGANAKAGARPTPSRAWHAHARPTKGGAVRNRIALATAVAVNVVAVPAVFTSLITSDPASAQATRHEAVSSHQGADHPPGRAPQRHVDVVLPGAQGRTDGELRQRSGGGPRGNLLQRPDLVQGGRSAGEHHPGGMDADGRLRRGGRNDPYAGYFGILEWNHFDGYPTAGSAPASVQLAWEAAHGQGPPDAPGQCHGY